MDNAPVIPGSEGERLKALWATGDFMALHEAFLLYGLNAQPLPGWVVQAIDAQLNEAFVKLGSPGQGKAGGYAKQAARADVHRQRWTWVRFHFAMEQHKGRAFEAASASLQGTPAQGAPAAMAESYRMIEDQAG